MRLRWLSALIGIPLFIGACLWGPLPFILAVTLIAAVGLFELLRAYWSHGIRANVPIAMLGLLGPTAYLLPYLHNAFLSAHLDSLVWIIVVLALIAEVAESAGTGKLNVGENLAYGLLSGGYIYLFSGIAGLRWYASGSGPPVASFPFPLNTPVKMLLLVVFCVWATDSFAFFCGKAFGKTKLAPKLSPGKTVEGAIGGLLAGILAGIGFSAWFFETWTFGLLIGAVVGVFGQIGDLLESALKREAGVKDFGAILPGHGGVLDRFDSLLLAASVVRLLLDFVRP